MGVTARPNWVALRSDASIGATTESSPGEKDWSERCSDVGTPCGTEQVEVFNPPMAVAIGRHEGPAVEVTDLARPTVLGVGDSEVPGESEKCTALGAKRGDTEA